MRSHADSRLEWSLWVVSVVMTPLGKTVDGFPARLRDETDLGAPSGDILAVVRETMQPEHASFWLAPARGKEGDD